MIDILRSIWQFLLEVNNSAPAAFWPCIVGLLFSALVTQLIKGVIYKDEWSQRAKANYTRLIAFLLGIGSTTFLWRNEYGFFCGAIVGCLSPFLYAVAVRLIGLRWPHYRDLLSQDSK